MTPSWGVGVVKAHHLTLLGNPAQPTTVVALYDPQKNIVYAILKVIVSTNPILSALHLKGPKFNTNVHFPVVNKQLIGNSFLK
jgi:hypothetical protein